MITGRTAAAAMLVLAAAAVGPVAGPVPAGAAGSVEANLKVVGHTDLGGSGAGVWDDVAVVGTTAVVSSAAAGCGPAAATVVDVKDPANPHVVAQVPVPDGLKVGGLDALAVTTDAFRGDLLALALRPCRSGATGAGVRYFDVSDPAAPRALGGTDAAEPRAVSLGVRPDGRVVAAVVTGGSGPDGPAVELDDATDPGRPALLGRWARPPGEAPPCPVRTADARLAEGRNRAVVAFDDGSVYDLELDDPAAPGIGGVAAGQPGAGQDPHVATVPVGQRTLVVVSGGAVPDADSGCAAAAPAPGVRVLALAAPTSMTELTTVRYPSAAAPGRLAVSGEQAFVAWHGDGLRVLDLGQVTPRTVAQFVPPEADVVGVGVLAADVVVTDSRSGLYVLQRPDEGPRESLWSKIKGAAGFMAIPAVFGAIWALPRLAMGSAPEASRSRVPVPVGRRRR